MAVGPIPAQLCCALLLSRIMIYTDLFIRFSIFFEIVDKIENWGGNYFFQHLDRASEQLPFQSETVSFDSSSDWV